MNNKLEFLNEELCTNCGGMCCKHMGCHLSPDDIKTEITYENLKELLLQGNHSIDWWENYVSEEHGQEYNDYEVKGFYLRIRNIDGDIIDPSWGGRCKLLTETGCSLSLEDRPLGARALEPKEGRCKSHYTKANSVDDWDKYYPILLKLYEEFY